jgi:hypothetical protein
MYANEKYAAVKSMLEQQCSALIAETDYETFTQWLLEIMEKVRTT